MPLAGKDVARGVAAIAGVQRAKPAKLAGFDQFQRHLIGRVPVRLVEQRIDRPAARRVAIAQAKQAVDLAHALGLSVGAVVLEPFHGREQGRAVVSGNRVGPGGVAAGRKQGKRSRQQNTAETVTTQRELRERIVQTLSVVNIRRSRRGKIAILGVIGALAIIDPLDQFWDQEVQVHVTLPVRAGWHVDRNAVDAGGEIRAVVQVVTAQKILVGLSLARMLRHHHAQDRLKHFAGTQQRDVAQQLAEDDALRCGIGRAQPGLVMANDRDGLQRPCRSSPGCAGRRGFGSGAERRGDRGRGFGSGRAHDQQRHHRKQRQEESVGCST